MTTTVRLSASRRLSNSLWGALVTASGSMMFAVFSGYDVDLELVGIIVLAAVGGGLLLSALLSGTRDARDRPAVTDESPTLTDSARAAAAAAGAGGASGASGGRKS